MKNYIMGNKLFKNNPKECILMLVTSVVALILQTMLFMPYITKHSEIEAYNESRVIKFDAFGIKSDPLYYEYGASRGSRAEDPTIIVTREKQSYDVKVGDYNYLLVKDWLHRSDSIGSKKKLHIYLNMSNRDLSECNEGPNLPKEEISPLGSKSSIFGYSVASVFLCAIFIILFFYPVVMDRVLEDCLAWYVAIGALLSVLSLFIMIYTLIQVQ